jgi:branched-chain amino acid transport system substrate-binding protein
MGPDGLDSPEMVNIGGSAVTGSYYTTVAGPPDAYPETAAFTKKFKQRFGREVESFGMYGYDATLVGIKGLHDWVKANGGKRPSRADIVTAVRNIKNFKGVTGAIQFDNKGDTLKAKYFVLQYDKQAYPGKVVKVIEQQAPATAKKS